MHRVMPKVGCEPPICPGLIVTGPGEAHDDGPVWETIVDGRAIVLGTQLRQRAYEVLASRFPDALDTLEVSRLAAAVDADLGQVTALMRQTADSRYRIDYFLDMRAAEDPVFLGRLAKHEGPKNFRDLQVGKETFTILQAGDGDVLRRGEFVRGPQRGSRVGVAVDTQKHMSRKQNVDVARLIRIRTSSG